MAYRKVRVSDHDRRPKPGGADFAASWADLHAEFLFDPALTGDEAAAALAAVREQAAAAFAWPPGAAARRPVSAHAEGVSLPSPDGRWVAKFHGIEIGMGGPTIGGLHLCGADGTHVRDLTDHRVNASMVWSSDSTALAIPRFVGSRAEGRAQELLIVPADGRPPRVAAAGPFRLLELHGFFRGAVTGVDSPYHRPRPIRVEAAGPLPPAA